MVALDSLMLDARRGRVDVVAVWSLDRFGRSLAHVCTAVQELHERGVVFASVREGLDL
jgi:DNA invertase Pin-like site-specific DNA recombinase